MSEPKLWRVDAVGDIETMDGEPIAMVIPASKNDEIAKLIAAAPVMLAALYGARDALRAWGGVATFADQNRLAAVETAIELAEQGAP